MSDSNWMIKVAFFRSRTQHGNHAKTYVYLGVHPINNEEIISVIRYFLVKDASAYDATQIIRKFKGMNFVREDIHFKVQSFLAICEIFSKHQSEIYPKIKNDILQYKNQKG